MKKSTGLRAVYFGLTVGLLLNCGRSNNEEYDLSSIYGDDDRIEIYQSPSSKLRNYARSTVSLIKKEDISRNQISGEKFGEKYNMCESERFLQQPAPAFCSGFLAGKDVIVTAGHCIMNKADCDNVRFVFDLGYMSADSSPLSTKSENIYKCKKIIKTVKDRDSKLDFAVIKLDRPVSGRPSLKIRNGGKIGSNTSITMIGNPAGLPLKISGNANVVANSSSIFFETNLDAFGGNSGSPVFNDQTGKVEGILVRGKSDFDLDGECTTSNRYDMNSATGEDVTRSVMFARFINDDSDPDPDPDPDPDSGFRIIKSEAYKLAAAAESVAELRETSLRELARALHFAASDMYRTARSLERARRPSSRPLGNLNHDYKLVKKTYNRLYLAYSRGNERAANRLIRKIITSYRVIKREMRR